MRPALVHLTLASILCVASIGGFAAWYVVISAKSAAVVDLEQQIVSRTDIANRIASARASVAEIAGDEASIQGYFVSNDQVASFINGLEALGKRVGAAVTVLSVSPGTAAVRPTLALSLSVTGTFEAVMRAIGAIEYAPYDLSIPMLSISQEGKGWRADFGILVGSVSTKAATTTP